MVDALKMSDTRLSDVDSFLATLLAEHDAPRARAQLKTLWIANVRSLLGDEDDAAPAAAAAGEGAGVGHCGPVVARLLDAKWPGPRRIASGRLAMGVETETETRRARGVHCG